MFDCASNEDIFKLDEEDHYAMPFMLGRINSNDSLFGGLIQRTASNDCLLGSILNNNFEPVPQRNLVLSIGELGTAEEEGEKIKVFGTKKIKRNKTSKVDYKKNICGYITKKIIREFVNDTFKEKVYDLCHKYKANYSECKSYYLSKIERVTGPSHIPELLRPACAGQVSMKRAFAQFFEWFLKERYMRYLMIDGKMEHKDAYIKYKNQALLEILHANTCPIPESESSIQPSN